MSPESPNILPIARIILRHFLRHPQAKDTLEGISAWRIAQENIDHNVEQVDAALAWLVRERYLKSERIAGAPSFWLNQERREEAARLLQEAGDRPSPGPRPLDPSPLLQQVIKWIDATLVWHHQQHPRDKDDKLGLSCSPATLDRLLGRRLVLDAHGQARDGGRHRDELRKLLEQADPEEPLVVLRRALGLSLLEMEVVVLALASDLDVCFQKAFAIFNDDLGKRAPTTALACALLGNSEDVRQELAQAEGLSAWRLFDQGETWPHPDQPLYLDPVIVDWLLGHTSALVEDARLAAVAHREFSAGQAGIGTSADADSSAGIVDAATDDVQWLVLQGRDTDGWRDLIEQSASRAGTEFLRLVVSTLASAPDSRDLLVRAARTVMLTETVPIVDAADAKLDAAERQVIDGIVRRLGRFEGMAVLIVRDVAPIIGLLPAARVRILRRDAPDRAAQAETFYTLANQAGFSITQSDSVRLAAEFASLASVSAAIRLAELESAAATPAPDPLDAITAACRRLSSPELPRFAQRIEPTCRFDDIVLPKTERGQLEEIVSHVRYAFDVLDGWGFGAQLQYGRGIGALLCGPSGTGKTSAALATARELRKDAYVVDLSRVVSKYIGESEKNLDAVFTEAERAGAVLVFDEADALFGKRSEIKDAHDRYANIEVAYLLQRVEAFNGLAILTTNFRQNLDPAFLRRLRFVIEFRKPDAAAREAIWRLCFPKGTPVAGDVNFKLLGKLFDLTGGNIRQITIRAAFGAVSDGGAEISLKYVIHAIRAELQKSGLPAAERELAELEAAERRSAARVA